MTTKILAQIPVIPFVPLTAKPGEEVQRKKDLRDHIIKNISNLSEIRDSCRGKERLSLDVCFNLYAGDSKDSSRYSKDLDNLLKIVLDVLPDYMDNKQENREMGLGIIQNDNQIFEIHASKQFVFDESLEGIKIIISNYLVKF